MEATFSLDFKSIYMCLIKVIFNEEMLNKFARKSRFATAVKKTLNLSNQLKNKKITQISENRAPAGCEVLSVCVNMHR